MKRKAQVEESDTKQSTNEERASTEAERDEVVASPEIEGDEKTASSDAEAETPDADDDASFPVIGMGASAGGLEAFEKFFTNMPSDSGMAFVLVPHLDPTHKSMMVELLKRCTKMSVTEVQDGMKVQPNHVYVIPPNKDMGIFHGRLLLMELSEPCSARLPIDAFLRSLAADQRQKAVCIILSGTGTSGTLGLKAIKGEGGMVMAQSPGSAKYDGMPRSAIATGLVDYTLPPEEMSKHLIQYLEHPYIGAQKTEEDIETKTDLLQKIFLLLRRQTGHDFSLYKPNTIRRRIERRMVLHQIGEVQDYVRYLQQNQHEVSLLFKELLIGVTSFFRDPEAFDALKSEVLSQLLDGRHPEQPVRIWAAACSTGEEAYSIAILFKEHMSEHEQDLKVQIFATDIDSSAIDIARAGIYPESISVDVTQERLNRFFTKEGNIYQINKEVRETVVFAVQNIVQDPPFSKLDIISCRNLLIYLGPELQKKLLPLFHYILNPNGVLFLGSSETIGVFTDSFSTVDPKWKIFGRKGLPSAAQIAVNFPSRQPLGSSIDEDKHETRVAGNVNLPRLTEKMLLDSYTPPCVLINEECDILYFHGRTGKYLEPAPGEARWNVVEMAREGMKSKLRSAIREVIAKKTDIRHRNIPIKNNGGFQVVDLTVKPVRIPESMRGLMMVVFEDVEPGRHSESDENPPASSADVDQRVAGLEQELAYTKENLQATIEELEASNEELKSTNEELQSNNEELQSTNEELETAKEELQSLNEELTTVNAELQVKIGELSEVNNDMTNLLDSTQIPTVFLDSSLCIKRFTPMATEIIHLIPTDVGRPIGHVVSSLIDVDLLECAEIVFGTLGHTEKEVQAMGGRWYIMRITPYRTTDNVIDGVVLTFADISERRRVERMTRASREYAEAVVEAVPMPLLVLSYDLKVISANKSFSDTFRMTSGETQGKFVYDLGERQWDIPWLREIAQVSEPGAVGTIEVEHELPDLGKRRMQLRAHYLHTNTMDTEMILLSINDMTGR